MKARNNSTEGFSIRLEARLKNADLVGARETLGMSVRAVADEMGIPYYMYLRYESMKTYPTDERIAQICRYFADRGVYLVEEEVFPKELKERKGMRRKFVLEKEIPRELLLPYSQVEQRLLPSVEGEIERELERDELIRDINFVLSSLPFRQEQILRGYFGIGTEKRTLQELAEIYNCDRHQIIKIRDEALSGLKSSHFKQILSQHLD